MLDWRFVMFFKGVVRADSSLLNVHLFVVTHLCILAVELLNELILYIDHLMFTLFRDFLNIELEVYFGLQTTHIVVKRLLAGNAVMWVELIKGVRVDLVTHVHNQACKRQTVVFLYLPNFSVRVTVSIASHFGFQA